MSLIDALEIARWLFGALFVVANVGVLIGVIWEGERFPKETQDRGWRLLVLSLGAEVMLGAFIFGTDGWISSVQRTEIAALESRLAARVLSPDDSQYIADRLAKLAPQSFEVIAYWEDQESVDIGNQIASLLRASKWTRIRPPGYVAIAGVTAGVVVYTDDAAPASAKEAANALAKLLNKRHIATVTRESQNRPPTARINITVGIKP